MRPHQSRVAARRRGGGGGSGGGKREAEWVEEWKERRIEAVRGGGSKRVNPEQVNTAVDRHGLSGCLSPVAPVLHTGVPGSQQGPAKAAAEWAGEASQARREAGEAGEQSSHSRRLGASSAEWSSAEQQKSIQRREASRGCPAPPAGLGAQGPTTTTAPSSSLHLSFYLSPAVPAPARARALTSQAPHTQCVCQCVHVCV